jgi:hypothetical protein
MLILPSVSVIGLCGLFSTGDPPARRHGGGSPGLQITYFWDLLAGPRARHTGIRANASENATPAAAPRMVATKLIFMNEFSLPSLLIVLLLNRRLLPSPM